MTRTSRRALFYTLVFFFLVFGAGAALYAQGWRLDIKTLTAKKVGAIYVESSPRDADITLDGKHVRRAGGFFQTGTLMNNILPRTHTLELSREGYRPWKRTLSVEPAKVTEAKYAVLVPQNAVRVSTATVRNLWVENGEEPIVQTVSSTISFRHTVLPGTNVRALAPDGKRAITEDQRKNALYLVDLTIATSTDFGSLLAKLRVSQKNAVFSFGSNDDTKILARSPRSLLIVDTAQDFATVIASTSQKEITAATAGSSRVAWAATSPVGTTSTIALYDTFQKTSRVIRGDLPGTTEKLLWVRSGILAALQDDGGLYLSRSDAPFEKLASDVRDFFPAPDGEKIAALERRSVEIFSLETKDYWRFNVQGVEGIRELSWFGDSHNLFLHFPDRVAMLDLDDSAQENITLVAETPKGVYDPETNVFFFLDGDSLAKIQFSE